MSNKYDSTRVCAICGKFKHGSEDTRSAGAPSLPVRLALCSIDEECVITEFYPDFDPDGEAVHDASCRRRVDRILKAMSSSSPSSSSAPSFPPSGSSFSAPTSSSSSSSSSSSLLSVSTIASLASILPSFAPSSSSSSSASSLSALGVACMLLLFFADFFPV
jgi:hypothetical protein